MLTWRTTISQLTPLIGNKRSRLEMWWTRDQYIIPRVVEMRAAAMLLTCRTRHE